MLESSNQTHSMLTTERLICTSIRARSGIGIPHRTLRLMHISSFLLIVRVCSTSIDMSKGHSIRVTTTVTSRWRLNACISSTVFLRSNASASVKETSFGSETELSGGGFLVASVVRVGLSRAAAAAE